MAVKAVQTRRPIVPILVSLAGAALVALLIYGVSAQPASRSLDERLAAHQHPAAPESARRLPLLGATGRASLASYRGRYVVLNFWASWCEPCRTEAPLLERAQRRLAQHAGTVLGVTYLDLSSDAQDFVRRYRLTYPQLRDTDGSFAHAYGTNQLPETFVIDRRGRVVALSRGEIDKRFLERAETLAESS